MFVISVCVRFDSDEFNLDLRFNRMIIFANENLFWNGFCVKYKKYLRD